MTTEERSFRVHMKRELNSPAKRETRHALRDAAEHSPGWFFCAGLTILESEMNSSERRRLYTELLECPEFLRELANPDRFDRKQFLEVCRWLKSNVDDFLDLRLARLTPGRHADEHQLGPQVVLRILEVLHAISSGPRLVQVISHLANHPHEQIASKATLLLGRRLHSEGWLRNRAQSADPRVRASVVEGLWGVKASYARKCFLETLRDENNRVAGNALFGLHLLGEPGVDQRIEGMLNDHRPHFRRTAAWLMGRIGKAEFAEALQEAQCDEDPGVRETATQALSVLPKPETTEAGPVEAEEPKEDKPAEVSGEATAPEPQSETPAPELEPPIFVPKFNGKYVAGL